MSLAVFIADQRTEHRVPHAVACRAWSCRESWFYKWHHRPRGADSSGASTDCAGRSDRCVRGGEGDLHGSPRILIDLRAAGWVVSEKTVAKSMAARAWSPDRSKRRKNILTRPDKRAAVPGSGETRLHRGRAERKWVGDMTEIPTGEGKLYLSTAIDLFSRRLLGYATGCTRTPNSRLDHQDGRHGPRREEVAGVIFHSTAVDYTAARFTAAVPSSVLSSQWAGRLGPRQRRRRDRSTRP